MKKLSAHALIELGLMAYVTITLLLGSWLVYQGVSVASDVPKLATDLNTADYMQAAHALGVSSSLGTAVVEARSHLTGGKFTSVYQAQHLTLLRTHHVSTDALVARTPAEGLNLFERGWLLFFVSFLLAQGVLRIRYPRADPYLLPITYLLSGIGLLILYSVKDPLRDSLVFNAQCIGIGVYGIAALLIPLVPVFARLNLRRYQYTYGVGAIVLMLCLIVFGHGPGGIHIRLWGFEPVEIIKILMVFFIVSYLVDKSGSATASLNPMPRIKDFAPLALLYAFALVLFVVVKDLGPALLLFGAFLAITYVSTRRAAYPIVGTALLLLACVVAYKIHLGFFTTRVVMWLHPWANSDPRGSQLAEGLWGFATGGPFGSGLGLGMPETIPRGGSDLIFASLGEQLGIFGTLSVLTLFGILTIRGFAIALRSRSQFDRLLACGVTVLLALQAIVITGGVSGLLPLTGVTLPFISFGTSSLVADFFSVGILLYLSAKSGVAPLKNDLTAASTKAIRNLSLTCTGLLIVGVGLFKLLPLEVFHSSELASRRLFTPGADGKTPGNENPRLLKYAHLVPRGEILDRNGTVLARDAIAENTDIASSILTPDGRSRIYSGGPAFGQIMELVESPGVGAGSLGQNTILRGFARYSDLLSGYRHRFAIRKVSVAGRNVTLTLDLKLQTNALSSLQQVLSSLRDRDTGKAKIRGAAVVVDVATGQILAAVSNPTFDPQTISRSDYLLLKRGSDPALPILNRAIYGVYPPGSTFKIVTTASALAHGLGTTVIDCRHAVNNAKWTSYGVRYTRNRITDEDGMRPHGRTDLAKAVRVSCNVYFANLGILLGADAIYDTAHNKFGFRYMPAPAALGRDLPDAAYGQGLDRVTPLEMASACQTVANGGLLMRPAFFMPNAAPIGSRAMAVGDATTLQQYLLGVTTSGTAAGVFNGLPVTVAGKTGSAQNTQGDKSSHSWFAGFAPADHPTLAFACIIENGGAGREAAAPVCRDILRAAF